MSQTRFVPWSGSPVLTKVPDEIARTRIERTMALSLALSACGTSAPLDDARRELHGSLRGGAAGILLPAGHLVVNQRRGAPWTQVSNHDFDTPR